MSFLSGLWIPQVTLSLYLCISCMAQSVWCSGLLDLWFVWNYRWWECVVLLHTCLNSLAWCSLSNYLGLTSCLRGTCLCWILSPCRCWWLCSIIWCNFCCEESDFGWHFMEESHSIHIKNQNRVQYSCDSVIYLLVLEHSAGFLRSFMPPWRSGLAVPYMWLALT